MKIGMKIILCINISGGMGMCIFLAGVACPPQLFKGFAHGVRNTHTYLACI